MTRNVSKIDELRDGLRFLKSGAAKADKEQVLKRVRQLEKELGYNLGDYNSADFATMINL